MNKMKEYVASRISVFDAATLDREIEEFLKKLIHQILSDIPWNGIQRLTPEVDALLKLLLWTLSVQRNGATFGQQLLCLKYKSNVSSNKLRLLGALLIGYSYFKDRSSNSVLWTRQLPNWVNSCLANSELVVSALNAISFLKFLRNGGSPNFVDNVLGVEPVSIVKPSARSIGYSYMTRELLWHGAIELFCLVLPHINVLKLGRIARNTVFGRPTTSAVARPPTFTRQALCSICHQLPIVPHIIGCEHFFCYFCISSSLLADSKFECPDCAYSNPLGVATIVTVK